MYATRNWQKVKAWTATDHTIWAWDALFEYVATNVTCIATFYARISGLNYIFGTQNNFKQGKILE